MKRQFTTHLFTVIVVLAIMSLSCKVGAIGNLFATPTMTPTVTSTATPTLTPTITPTVTPTPIPEAIVVGLPDGSTQFTDLKAGYRFTFPKGWLVINLAVDDPQQALEDAIEANPDKATVLGSLSVVIDQKGRMAAADFAPGHYVGNAAPILFVVNDLKSRSLPLEDILTINGELLPQIMNAKVTVSAITTNPMGTDYGVIDVIVSVSVNDTSASVIEKIIMFKADDYTVIITFAVAENLLENALPAVNTIIDSIEVIAP